MKIGVAGAGALGSYFGGLLESSGHDVLYLARGKHLEKMKENGITLELQDGSTLKVPGRFTTSYEEFADVALVLFCVKAMDTKNTADHLKEYLNKDAIILTVQNGVDNEEILAEIFGKEKIMSVASYVQAHIKEPGVIKQIRDNPRLVMGALDPHLFEKVEKVAEMFTNVDIEVELTNEILKHKWKKLLWNISINPLSALVEVQVKYILDDIHLRTIAESICKEAANVARADGVDFENDIDQIILQSAEKARNHRTSMLQDKIKGKKLEIESICGFIIRRGEQLGIKTPVVETIYHLLKYIDIKNIESRSITEPI